MKGISAKGTSLLLYLSPFVFPLYLLRFQIGPIPFTFLEVYTYLLFACFIFTLLAKAVRLNWEKPLRPYYFFTLMLFLGGTLGVFTAPHYIPLPGGILLDAQITALGIWKGWLLAPMLYFLVFTQTIQDENHVKSVLLHFIYSGALVSLMAYGLAIFGNGLTYDLRLAGFFESANYLSLYLVPILLLSTHFILHGEGLSRAQKILNGMALMVVALALFLTQSYAAIIAVFGALGLYILVTLLKKRMQLRKLFITLILLFLVFGAILFSQLNSPKFKQFLDWDNRSSTSVRLEIYEVAWNLIQRYPVTGVGPGLFQAHYQTEGPEILGKAPMEWNIPHPHNVFFAFWLNAGLLGFIAFMGFIFLAHQKWTYPLLAFWGILIHGLFDTPFWKNDLAMIFWLILGAIVTLQIHEAHSSKKQKNPVRRFIGVSRSSSARAKRLKA